MAQSKSDFKALDALFGQKKVEQLKAKTPEKVAYMAYVNRHGYEIKSNTGNKDLSGYPDALKVMGSMPQVPPITESIIESKDFNLLAYRFTSSAQKRTVYRIGDSGKILVVKSTGEVTKEMANNQNSQIS